MSEVTTSTAPLPSSAVRSAPTPERSAPPKSNAATSVSSRSAAWIVDALFLSRYAGLTRSRTTARRARCPAGATAQREPGRLDAHRGGVLVVGGDRPGALAAAAAERLRDLGPVEAPERARSRPALMIPRMARRVYDGGVGSGPAGAPRIGSRPVQCRRATRRRRERGRAAVRQAARRRARARGRADAGAAVRDAAARPARRRRREGRAPGARRVGPGVDAGDDRPRGPQGRRHLPAQQLQQAQRRHRPEVARGPRAVPRARAAAST